MSRQLRIRIFIFYLANRYFSLSHLLAKQNDIMILLKPAQMKPKPSVSQPLISVIIPNFNGERFLERCLQSVFLEKERPFEVIVVDDGSTDRSVALLKKKFGQEKKLKIVALKNHVGAAEARNVGVKASRGKYLLFLDNDTKIKKGWSGEIINFFKENKKAGMAQEKILKMGSNQFDYAGDYLGPFGFLIERARSAPDKGQFNRADKIFALKSAAMLARRDVFIKLGGFDSDYKIFWEDTDIAWRSWLAGYEVLFAPKIVVWHAYGTKEKDQEIYQQYQVTYRGCKNMITTLIKNLGFKKLILILPVNLSCWSVLALLSLARLDISKSLAIIKGILWNFIHFSKTLRKRKEIQAKRIIGDEKLFALVGAKKTIPYYLGKGLAYVRGKPF